jgi:hypothetical protein
MNRETIVKALQFHIREWQFEPSEVRGNFHNNVKEYIAFKVKVYPALNLRRCFNA